MATTSELCTPVSDAADDDADVASVTISRNIATSTPTASSGAIPTQPCVGKLSVLRLGRLGIGKQPRSTPALLARTVAVQWQYSRGTVAFTVAVQLSFGN